MSKTYHIHTFGCQMNVADSGHVAAELDRLGYLLTGGILADARMPKALSAGPAILGKL